MAVAVGLGILVGVVVFDQLTKRVVLVLPSRPMPSPVRLLTPRMNSHAILCRFPVTITLPVLVILGWLSFAVTLFSGLVHRPELVWLGVACALGGALSNVLDRVCRGAIVDFVRIGPWPAFNAADAAIVIGVTLALAFAL